MTMETDDNFKTFDKGPIITSVVHIKQWAFGVREVILAMIAALLLLLCLIFAGLFGQAESELSAVGSPGTSAALISQSYCEDKGCLDTAAKALDFMNKSVDPCDNFYEFACGNYKSSEPVSPNTGSRSVLKDLHDENEDRLIEVMERPVARMTDWAAERKLKHMFQACNDMYTREKNKGKPFLDQIVSAVGGWDAIGTWDSASWNINTALKKVQSDFWVDALYQPTVGVDWYSTGRYAIQMSPAGTGKWMYWSWYTQPTAEKYRTDYKKFIRRVGFMLQRDANVNMTTEEKEIRLDQFVNDTFTIESNIAEVAQDTRYQNDPYLEVNKVSLNTLNQETNDVIDWVDQLSYLFTSAGVNGNTKVVLLRRDYFKNITDMIGSLPDEDRNRMMHNYFVWRMAEIYVQELSWEYIHANREIFEDIYGRANFMGVYKYCFYLAKSYMKDALSSLFVADHLSDKNREAVKDITSTIKTTMQEQLEQTPWMDRQTKDYAKVKLQRVTFKMGYPDWMTNHDQVDQIYIALSVNISDNFANMLGAQQFVRASWSKILRDGQDRREWLLDTWSTSLGVHFKWNEIIVPAGVLQSPIYDASRPHSATFGSLGAFLGHMIHHMVDDLGKHYDQFGTRLPAMGTWWSNSSMTKYDAVHTCVSGVYSNISKTYKVSNGMSYPVYVNTLRYTPEAIAITNGVRLALKGYKKWASERGLNEKMIPGLHLTNEQTVFLAHAQTQCYNRDDYAGYFRALRGNTEEDVKVNSALGQLQEFSDVFGCKVGSKMNHAKKCDYY